MTNQNSNFNANDLISFLWKSRKILVILGVLAAVSSAVVSLLIEEKFKSVVTIYPTMSSSVVFSETITEDQDVAKFGEEEQVEQMLQILESSAIRQKVVNKYQLMQHYQIDTTDDLKNLDLSETYSDLISYSRNKNGAVLIEVLDKSPDTAMLIAAYISELYDSTKNSIIHERAMYDFTIKKEKLEKLQNDMNMINDTMSKLTSLGVVTQDAYEALTVAMMTAKDPETKAIYQKKIDMTEKYGSVLKSFEVQVEFLSERLATYSSAYELAETNAHHSISHRFKIEDATKPYKKSYPIRWLIVVVSVFSTLFLAIVLLLFYEKFKELKELD